MKKEPSLPINIYTDRQEVGIEFAIGSLECDGLPPIKQPPTIIHEQRRTFAGRFFPPIKGCAPEENYLLPDTLTRDDLFVNPHLW